LVIAATLVVGLLFLMTAFQNSSSPVAPKVQAAGQGFRGGASPEMLAYALDLKSGNAYAVFGGHGVRNHGNSTFRGQVASTGSVSGVATVSEVRNGHGQGRQDLSDAVKIFNQLPCEDVNQTDLTGTTFTPGVYCLSSASLAGTMTMSAEGDPNGVFIFRVSGGISAGDNSTIALSNGAKGTDVYFVSNDTISIGDSSDISANLISKGEINVGDASTVTGKVLSVDGDVNVTNSVLGAGTGSVEICKTVPQGDPIGQGTIFNFTISGVAGMIQAPAGGCSAPFDVPAGNATITELTVANTAVTAISVNPASRAVSQSLPLRQQVINVPEGGVADQTVVTYTNQTTRTGTLEICKRALDSGVTGTFNYTVQGAAGTFAVPTGFCSGAITTTVVTSTTPTFTVNVTEIGRPNLRLEDVTTFPAGRLTAPFTPNPDGGGTANVILTVGGGVNQQTTVNFFNRSLPGRVKVCKITADPVNIPVGTMFRFAVTGTNPTSPTQTLPGVVTTVNVDVAAGPAAQGGFCQFVPGTFIVDSAVTVVETGLAPGASLPFGFTFADTRVSRIRATTSPLSANLTTRTAVFPAANNTAEVEFTNFIFRPAILKICKVAGTGVTNGTIFNFNLSLVDPLTSLPVSTATIPVPAGSCAFASGPFPALEAFPGIGTFNISTQLIVTEAATAGVSVTTVSSPTSPVSFNLGARTGTITFNQLATSGLFNEIVFTNSATVVTPPASFAARYDFDGDGSSDPVIYRPSAGTWWYAASGANNQFRAVQWGISSDKPVSADYDGDRRSDFAIYRGGTWYIMGSAGNIRIEQFGLSGDIPQPGDYDGDGKADLAVYRPSDSTWYMMGSQNGFSAVRFGLPTDLPEAADYDGDGRMDQAVYRAGTWYLLGSTSGFGAFQFGIASDIPVPADYNGDGKADASVYRNGQWYIRAADGSASGPTWGMSGDVPVPADYDGDGRTDAAIFRPSSNTWWILKSSQSAAGGGYVSFEFGSNGDMLMNY